MNLDKKNLVNAFNRAAATYDQAAILQKEIAQRLIDHLKLIKIQPKIILDFGAKTGLTTKLLKKNFPNSQIIAYEFAAKMLHKTKRNSGWFFSPRCLVGNFENLPFSDNSVDLLFSNLNLLYSNDLTKTFLEIHRILSPQGLFIFTTYGPDTLKEMRASWSSVDKEQHVYDFIDMHDIGDMLLQTNFDDPVMEMEFLTMTYQNLQQLFSDLKKTANQNLLTTRSKNLTGKNKFKNFINAYGKQDGIFPATFEIIYGHAWKHPQNPPTEVTIPIDQIVIKNKINR